ncbi:MAG: LptF/LptG family permease [Planctomycetia bacterium]|nr:LptF/LptG family permease [Planctomycetia bacterium]
MKIIPGKILREIFILFLIVQLSFTMLFVVLGLTFQGVFDKIPLGDIPYIIPYIFPFSQYYASQLTMVLTVCVVYSRLNASREIIALQSSGISALRVMLPAFLLGLLMSFFSWYMGELHNTWGRYGISRAVSTYAETIFYNILAENENISFGNYSLSVEGVEGKTLIHPVCSASDEKLGGEILFSADTACVQIGAAKEFCKEGEALENITGAPFEPEDPEETVVKITFERVNSRMEDIRTIIPRTKVVYLPVSALPIGQIFSESREDYPPSMSPARLVKYAKERQEAMERNRQQMALAATRQLLTGSLESYQNPQWDQMHRAEHEYRANLKRVRIEFPRRWAMAFNCFCLAWLCTPLALIYGKKGALQLFTVVILPILLIFYYPLCQVMLNWSKQMLSFPVELQLLPNILAFLAGIPLIRRAM